MRDHQLGYFERFAPLGPVKRAMPPLPIDGLYTMYVEPAAPAETAKPAKRKARSPEPWQVHSKPPAIGMYETLCVWNGKTSNKIYTRQFDGQQWRHVHIPEKILYCHDILWRMPAKLG